MKLFASLSCAHKYGIPIQGFFLSILVILCCVQNVSSDRWEPEFIREKLDFICDESTTRMKQGDPDDSEYASTGVYCNVWHQGTAGWETPSCGANRGHSLLVNTDNTNTKRFYCHPCRSDQVLTWDYWDELKICRCKKGYSGSEDWNGACAPCQTGKYTESSGETVCRLCGPGTSSAAGSSSCYACAAGEKSDENRVCVACPQGQSSFVQASVCINCDAGKYNNVAGTECKWCDAGKYSSGPGFHNCLNCNAGKYSSNGGQGEYICTNCPTGKYSTSGSGSCQSCNPGMYSSQSGMSSCETCGEGTYSRAGSANCGECGLGYEGIGSSCTPCRAGQFKDTTGAGNCQPCGLELYSNSGASKCSECIFPLGAFVEFDSDPAYTKFTQIGWYATGCRSCPDGKYADKTNEYSTGANECIDCWEDFYINTIRGSGVSWSVPGSYWTKKVPCTPCRECPTGTNIGCVNTLTDPGICNVCVPGERVTGHELCAKCEVGKYQDSNTLSINPWNCKECPKFTRRTAPHTLSTSPVGSKTLAECVCNSAYGLLPTPFPPGDHCSCGTGKVFKDGKCEPSPINTYQPHADDATGEIKCTSGSVSNRGSTKPTDCTCTDATIRTNLKDGTFECDCPVRGQYFDYGGCSKCKPCPFRQWRTGCTKDSPGECVPCSKCDFGKTRVGCNWIEEGTCEDLNYQNTPWLSREPLCPDITETTTRQDVGVMQDLGGFGFEEVFGVVPEYANFACGQVCDGTTDDDGTQCGGPFACGVRTCVENMRADLSVDTASEFDVLACPVTISPTDDDDVKFLKTMVSCVSCENCGNLNSNYDRTSKENWGAGCVRECSQLRCTLSEIWDWTLKKCVQHSDLRDQRLCTKQRRDELQLHSMVVTGYLPMLYFEGSSGQGELDKITYGKCHKCVDQEGRCRDVEYPNSCRLQISTSAGSTNVESGCGVCERSLQGDVGVVKGSYKNSTGVVSSLYCQITNCNPKENVQRTGVRQHAICLDRCLALVCGNHEIMIPCRLPHQTRCDTVWPAGAAVAPAFDGFQRHAMAGPEVNLFSEKRSAGLGVEAGEAEAGGDGAVGFASFENTLITLTVPLEHYQCVWNAARINDNRAFPGGISEFMFPPSDAFWTRRGSKACELWDPSLDSGDGPLPVLPLQNTVSGTSPRRVMINTEAHVLSYEYKGVFAGVNQNALASQKVGPVEVYLEPGNGALTGAHAGGRGKLYLMMTVRRQEALVVIDVPADRNLGIWPKSLLLTCAVADMTPGGGGVRFSAHYQNGNEAALPLHSQSQHMGMSIDRGLFDFENLADEKLNRFRLGFTGASRIAWNLWSTSVIQPSCPKLSVESFLEDEGACRVLRHTKPVPMQMKITVVAACDETCRSILPIVLFYAKNAFGSAKVEGASTNASEVDVGTASADLLEMSQRRALRRMQNFTNIEHAEIAGAPFERRLNWQGLEMPRQAHAVDAYSKCAVLLATDTGIVCAGSEGIETLWKTTVLERAIGVAFAEVEGRPLVLALMDMNIALRIWKLYVIEGTSKVLVQEALMVGGWVSFAVLAADVVSLEVGADGHMKVATYLLSFVHPGLHISPRTTTSWNVFKDESFLKKEEPWLRFSRVVTTPRSLNAVVAVVRDKPTELDTTVLYLMVCAVPWVPDSSAGASSGFSGASVGVDAALCAEATVDVAERAPGFISVGFLGVRRQQESEAASSGPELWVVGVLGVVFELELGKTAVLVKKERSQLAQRSFVQVGAAWQVQKTLSGGRADAHAMQGYGLVYYTMNVSHLRTPTDGRLVAFLPGFLRVDTASLSAEFYISNGRVARFGGYEMLVAYTGTNYTQRSELSQLEISIEPSVYRESQRGHEARVMEVMVPNVGESLGDKMIFQYDQTLEDSVGKWLVEEGNKFTMLELAMPEVLGRASDCYGAYVETELGKILTHSIEDALAMLLVFPCNILTRSIVILVRVGYAPNNYHDTIQNKGLRGLALARCHRRSAPEITCGPSVDSIGSVQESVDAGSPAGSTSAVLSFNRDTKNWTIHSMDDAGRIDKESSSSSTCISLAPGSVIVMARGYESGLRDSMLEALLREQSVSTDWAEEKLVSLDVPARWQRERFVVESHEEMRVRLSFKRAESRGSSEIDPSIGLDDIQLLPMLVGQTSMADSGDHLEAYVQMPSRAELERVGLAHLERLGEEADGEAPDAAEGGSFESAWARLHVTVALKVGSAERSGCRYQAQFYYQDNTSSAEMYFLPIGCELAASSAHVRGAWAQCMLELPLDRPKVDLLVKVSVSVNSSQPSSCGVKQDDLVLVFIDANTALYECPAGSFLAGGESPYAGVCAPCRGGAEARSEPEAEATRSLAPTLAEEAVLCGKGSFLEGCPALLSKHASHSHACVMCEVSEVNADRALWADVQLEDAEPCKWKCRDEFYETGHGTGRKCVRCGEPESCSAGLYWKNCSATGNSACTACPDLRGRTGADGEVRERYVDAADIEDLDDVVYPFVEATYNSSMKAERRGLEVELQRANGTHVCRSRCLAGAFRGGDGMCKRCTPAGFVLEQQLEKSLAGDGYFAVFPCTPGNDTYAKPCPSRNGTKILGHDPAETGDCPRECISGWSVNATFINEDGVAYISRCAQCANVTRINAQYATRLSSETEAGNSDDVFEFALNTCALACKPPYLLLRERLRWVNESNSTVPEDLLHFMKLDPERTCVRCSGDACGVGRYPTGLLCECAQCVMDDLMD